MKYIAVWHWHFWLHLPKLFWQKAQNAKKKEKRTQAQSDKYNISFLLAVAVIAITFHSHCSHFNNILNLIHWLVDDLGSSHIVNMFNSTESTVFYLKCQNVFFFIFLLFCFFSQELHLETTEEREREIRKEISVHWSAHCLVRKVRRFHGNFIFDSSIRLSRDLIDFIINF